MSGAHLFAKEMVTDGTSRRHLGSTDLMPMMQRGFSEYVVAVGNSFIKIDANPPFHAGSLVSCGVTTGWGSATACAGTQTGDTVVVIGVGGVGMNPCRVPARRERATWWRSTPLSSSAPPPCRSAPPTLQQPPRGTRARPRPHRGSHGRPRCRHRTGCAELGFDRGVDQYRGGGALKAAGSAFGDGSPAHAATDGHRP